MTALPSLWLAEMLKLSSRGSARGVMLALLAVGGLGPVWLWLVLDAGITYNGGDLGAQIDVAAPNGVRWAFVVRGFYVAQALWLLLAAQSVGGELQAHTLREELLRPVSRQAVLLAKWAALSTWSLLSVLGGFALGAALGLVLLPAEGQATWLAVGEGAFGAWIADVCFLAFALAVSAVTRSVAGGVVATLLFLMLDRTAALGLWVLHTFLTGLPPDLAPTVPPWLTWLMQASPWLPSNAWAAWRELLDGAPILTWQSWAALALWTLLSCVVAERAFARTDVP